MKTRSSPPNAKIFLESLLCAQLQEQQNGSMEESEEREEEEWSQQSPFTQNVATIPQIPAVTDIIEALFQDIAAAGKCEFHSSLSHNNSLTFHAINCSER